MHDTDEYNYVASEFEKTLPPRLYQIQRIERIQNKLLWQRYFDCVKRLKKYNCGVTNEMNLFHGTSSNLPEKLYKGDAGFDMRYSNMGMWGRGNYFAVNASYSDSYAYRCPGGRHQMLMAYVFTGYTYCCQPNSFTKPPERPAPHGNVHRRYDSVSGVTGGSKVFITYENDRACPAYLITYVKN